MNKFITIALIIGIGAFVISTLRTGNSEIYDAAVFETAGDEIKNAIDHFYPGESRDLQATKKARSRKQAAFTCETFRDGRTAYESIRTNGCDLLDEKHRRIDAAVDLMATKGLKIEGKQIRRRCLAAGDYRDNVFTEAGLLETYDTNVLVEIKTSYNRTTGKRWHELNCNVIDIFMVDAP